MIRALVQSDDGQLICQVNDATPWFVQASDEEIVEMMEGCHNQYEYCGGCEIGDDMCYFLEDIDEDVRKFFAVFHDARELGLDFGGFEGHVHSQDAVEWIADNRPHLVTELGLSDQEGCQTVGSS